MHPWRIRPETPSSHKRLQLRSLLCCQNPNRQSLHMEPHECFHIGVTTLKVAIIQAAPVFMNLDASLARAVEFIGEAAALGAKLVVFGEPWLPGYPAWLDYC